MEKQRKPLIKHDYKFLLELCNENNIVLLKDYSSEKVGNKTRIEGNCLSENCGKPFNKTVEVIIKYGGYCKNCSEKNKKEKREKTCMD